jgi:hypothetical protein
MAKQKSELATLRESIHSLAEALQLLRNIFQGQAAALNAVLTFESSKRS